MSSFPVQSVIAFLAAIFLLLPPARWAAAENPAIPPVIANETVIRPPVVLDDFEDLSGWRVTTSPGARLEIAQDAGLTGRAMRL